MFVFIAVNMCTWNTRIQARMFDIGTKAIYVLGVAPRKPEGWKKGDPLDTDMVKDWYYGAFPRTRSPPVSPLPSYSKFII